ncbi:MAG: bifunctional phosphoribosyl-AMP cyclohydrolase/phosphoribosyl-ATP diphosphatase HisIE [Clostridia bacterium]|nr:bifunctional phosphoribosyl-AMP cyclohydrolase/phosphoribosyl-ATP diphosphatase HisIE [Clostridia bacterium]
MISINELKYNEKGLIPAIVTDSRTGKVLMLAYMNRESLEITLKEERTCFFSRSRNELWRKGETSGNVQNVVSISTDCDMDTLLINVIPAGPACHTGNESCFFNTIVENAAPFTIEGLMDLIKGRKTDRKEGSYTTYLFDKGRDKILKKVGEESTEVIIAGKADDKAETIYELADLMYHALVLMADMEISVDDVMKELASRHVIDKKVKQEKMV